MTEFSESITPQRLLLKLTLYFLVMLGSLLAVAVTSPGAMTMLPFGGTDAIEVVQLDIDEDSLRITTTPSDTEPGDEARRSASAAQVGLVAVFLVLSLAGTILVMLPITWTYMATKRETGHRRTFVRALIVLPICATTIVLLIQDSLALAFGLAAMVAAVRFRVALQEAIDGIYIFASICVGLAAGIGYMGIAIVMAIFFCFTNAVLWSMDYGRNPIDDAERAKKRAKLEAP